MRSTRSFVAVPLPAAVQTRIFTAAQALARELPGVKWSRKVENLHVTVKFLGQVPDDRLEVLGAALDRTLSAVPRFGIDVRGMGAFPSAHRASIVWAGIDDQGRGLAAVAEVVESTAAALGLPRQERPFRGHVTVGRCGKGGAGLDARAALASWSDHRFGAVTVGEVHVYESRLGGQGSTYLLRSRAALGAGTN